MKELLEIIAVSLILILPYGFNVFFMRSRHANWWSHRAVRLILAVFPAAGLLSALVRIWGLGFSSNWVNKAGALTFGLFLIQLALSSSLGLTSVLNNLFQQKSQVDPTRRRLLRSGLAAVPLLATGTCLAGLTGAAEEIKIPLVEFKYPELHPDLSGLKILHLSDVHLAHFITLEDLKNLLERAKQHKPDLIVVTGDFSDDLHLLPESLQMLDDFEAPLGVFAVLGNHEYRHGALEAGRLYAQSQVQLLVNQRTKILVGEAQLSIMGIDDPLGGYESESTEDFFATRVAAVVKNTGESDFRLLLSHRPDAFDSAASHDVELMLAGHTHGGQLGFNGRSLVPTRSGCPYTWGPYQIGESQLYTSAGTGHWLPIRWGCPAEAPVIVLQKG